MSIICTADCKVTMEKNTEATIKCNGPCEMIFHDVCAELPRNWTSSRLAGIIRSHFTCTKCKNTGIDILEKMNDLEALLNAKFTGLDEKMNKLIKDSTTNHNTLSDGLDNLSRDIDNIKTGENFFTTLFEKTKAKNNTLNFAISDLRSELTELKNSLAKQDNMKTYIDDIDALISTKINGIGANIVTLSDEFQNLTKKVEASLNASFDTFDEDRALKNKPAPLSTSLFDEIRQISPEAEAFDDGRVDNSPKKIASKPVESHHVSVPRITQNSKHKKDRNENVELIETDAGFNLVINKKKQMTKKVYFDDKVKKNIIKTNLPKNRNDMKDPIYDLIYITKTPTYMNEGVLSRFIKTEFKIKDHSCHLVVPFNKTRSELKYLNFKVRVLRSDVDLLLRKENWPHGVVPRKWVTGFEKRKGENNPPLKPDFRRN